MTRRIAMWSGPRNISTAMMRAFENREDCAVSDEPFYAAYLAATGIEHPMRDEVLAGQPQDWRIVAAAMAGEGPGGASLWYQKHMAHHMLPGMGLAWTNACQNVFLIRRPERVLASYVAKRGAATLDDIGVVRQHEIFEHVAQRSGETPLVIDSEQILADPETALRGLCTALDIPFSDRMLHWPAGRRASDGIWAPVWYDAVERSTGFAPPSRAVGYQDLPDALKIIADAAQPYYDRLAQYRLGFGGN
jgi:hypothetical protein